MFEEIEKGVLLRDLVAELLRSGPRSISQVGHGLKERGLKLHRLAVAGYLKALADAGFLEEREIPPAKVYSLRPASARRDVYTLAAQRCRDERPSEAEAARLFLHVLWDMFHRPIFRDELRRGGFEAPRPASEVEGEERQAARRHLSKSPLKLPFNDAAYRPSYKDGKDETALRETSQRVLAAMVRDELGVAALAMTSKQVTLGAVE